MLVLLHRWLLRAPRRWKLGTVCGRQWSTTLPLTRARRSRSKSLSVSVFTNLGAAFRVPLTVADLHLRHEQLPFAYFFQNETLCKVELQKSLTGTLQQFFAVAGGTISKDYTAIDCTVNDTIPLTFRHSSQTLADLRYIAGAGTAAVHVHQSGQHPVLHSLFDSLQDGPNLLSVRVTYFGCGSTCLGVTFNHLLGDTASCVQLVSEWGAMNMRSNNRNTCAPFSNVAAEAKKEHRCHNSSNNRSTGTVSGMMTLDSAQLFCIGGEAAAEETTMKVPTWMTAWLQREKTVNKGDMVAAKTEKRIDHEYVPLYFSVQVLTAMKKHGMADSNYTDYVSTNDLVSAAGWLLKRKLSGLDTWGISSVVNLRGRNGVPLAQRDFLFGNAISSVVTKLAPTTNLCKDSVRTAAHAIRQSLLHQVAKMPKRVARSRLGKRNRLQSSLDTFSTTSWLGQLEPWKIQFSTTGQPLSAFIGQPAHPLPAGQRTFASVVQRARDGGLTKQLFLPSDKAAEARHAHERLCASYVEWYERRDVPTK